MCVGVQNHIAACEKLLNFLFFGVKKCMSKFWRQVAAKYTTLEAKFSFASVLSCILQREHYKAIK